MIAVLQLLALLAPLDGAQYVILREGSWFVREETGVLPAPGQGGLRIVSPGTVYIRGQARPGIRYVYRRRVKARDLASARRLLSEAAFRYTPGRGEDVLLLASGRAGEPPPEMELEVPHALTSLRVAVGEGAITAVDLDGALDLEAAAGPIVADRIRSRLAARTGGGEIRLGAIQGAIDCQSDGGGITVGAAGSACRLRTGGGEVFVRESAGWVDAQTTGGNIQIWRALSGVTARTGGGLVEVNQAAGRVAAHTSGGGIQVGVAHGVDCDSGGGPIVLHSVSGRLRATTANGSIVARLAGLMTDSRLTTSSGDITVFLPSNLAVTVQAEMRAGGSLGAIDSDFAQIAVPAEWPLGRVLRASGRMNGGGPTLSLSAVGGTISLKRQRRIE